MTRSLIPLLLVAVSCLVSCHPSTLEEGDPPIPQWETYYRIEWASPEGKALASPGGYVRITQPAREYDKIGFGGLLVINSFLEEGLSGNTFFAYDLACPLEREREVRLFVNDRLEAECPICHSRFSILYGGGNPVGGKARAPLTRYAVLREPSGLLVRNI